MNLNPEIRLIWIAPKYPLGVPDGARHATRSLIRCLSGLRAGVDLICLHPKGEPTDENAVKTQLGAASCLCIPRKSSNLLPALCLRAPWTFRTFAAAATRRQLRREISRLLDAAEPGKATFIVFDGLHTFAALNLPDLQELSRKCRGIVYRAHNFESTFWEQCAQNARFPWLRWFFQRQTHLVRTFERRMTESADLIAPVSQEDADRFQRLVPDAVVSVTRIGMDFQDEQTIPLVGNSGEFEILFIGKLDWLPNRAGLAWFLEKVWPSLRLKRPGAALAIAGTGNSRWLRWYLRLPGIKFLGRVENLDFLYASCALTIAPIFQGSGTRVKILEAARYKRAVVTTALGAEGAGLTPGSSYYRAETQEEWIAALEHLTLNECRAAGLKAFEAVRTQFDAGSVAERFSQVLRFLNARASQLPLS